ncbi:5-formyltetrahydrofolate cyclo-ligase [Gulosibacter sp. ACHW.36C]|uniref:5-formyltetrahydrofolate cyclo-ligase n=1 Tax=Gulosibacter sediminis TaxID=1729695 RepID=A0ABY4MYV3_9MICO|nr:5-formyltetrahydrofolate cyclo-ligase [Gulosibacter sediminis]UQN15579.1 5-formyltetrahydrofolate cyclo-ligase [Gulosibacter sediminis]
MASKYELRATVRGMRRMRGQTATAALADSLAEQLRGLTRKFDARVVACFASTTLEPPTTAFLSWARDHDVQVLLPRASSETTLEWCVDTGELTEHPRLRVPEPLGPALASGLDTAELLLLPAAAADRSGTRLGWGGGYYDRALEVLEPEQRARLVAVVHDDEVLERLPREPHDVRVAGIVTPSMYLDTRANSS